MIKINYNLYQLLKMSEESLKDQIKIGPKTEDEPVK